VVNAAGCREHVVLLDANNWSLPVVAYLSDDGVMARMPGAKADLD
jgi:hypothetical protein